MPTLNDFTNSTAAYSTRLPHAGGARTDKGSPPVTTHEDGGYGLTDDGTAYGVDDRDPVAPVTAATLHDVWTRAYAVLERTDAEWAELHARHGPGGQADAHRRAYRGAIATRLRQDAREATPPRKLTEAECEDAACADDGYLALLTAMEAGAVRYALLTSERARAKETMEWCRTRAYMATAEARLMPGGGGV